MNMTASRWVSLVSAVFGAVGAWLLFRGSFALAQGPSGYGLLATWQAEAGERRSRNRRRLLLQRMGLALILVSFALQGVAAVVP